MSTIGLAIFPLLNLKLSNTLVNNDPLHTRVLARASIEGLTLPHWYSDIAFRGDKL